MEHCLNQFRNDKTTHLNTSIICLIDCSEYWSQMKQILFFIIIDKSMERQYLQEIIEDLETFIELKHQNHMILAWIQLKKNMKLSNHHPTNRGHHHSFRSNPNSTYPYTANHNRISDLGRSQLSEHPRGYNNTQRYVTQYANTRGLNEEMFQTFNKNGSGYNFVDLPRENHYEAYNRNIVPFDQERELEDDDQFEDIVLDRLSKLQENINEMMKQKRLKQNLRGYVGAPIQSHPFRTNLEQEIQIDTSGTFQYGMQSDSEHSPRYRAEGHFQSWQTSPIKNKKDKDPTFNMKYIPIQKNSPVNVSKLKQMLEKSKDEDDNILNNPKYFRSKQPTDRRNAEETLNNQEKEQMIPFTQRRIPAKEVIEENIISGYYNRYGVSKTTRNNQIHFVPKNLEIKTTVEPKNRYTRSYYLNKNQTGTSNHQPPNQAYFKPRKSGASDSSGHSNFSMPSWRANLSSLY